MARKQKYSIDAKAFLDWLKGDERMQREIEDRGLGKLKQPELLKALADDIETRMLCESKRWNVVGIARAAGAEPHKADVKDKLVDEKPKGKGK
jgi:hypothetical protein